MNRKSFIITVTSILTVLIAGTVLVVLYLSGVIFIKEKQITDFNDYKKIESVPTSIEVTFDDEYTGTFTITDKDQIQQIHSLMIERVYTKSKNPPVPGTNRTMKFIYSDGTKILLNTRFLKVNSKYYLPEKADTLDSLLKTIGITKGKINER